MGYRLTCPCGERMFGSDDAELVDRARRHLHSVHPGRDYSDEEILVMAVHVPDDRIPRS